MLGGHRLYNRACPGCILTTMWPSTTLPSPASRSEAPFYTADCAFSHEFAFPCVCCALKRDGRTLIRDRMSPLYGSERQPAASVSRPPRVSKRDRASPSFLIPIGGTMLVSRPAASRRGPRNALFASLARSV